MKNSNVMIVAFMLIMAMVRVLLPSQGIFSSLAAFTPVGAMALYGGAYFKGGMKFIFPLVTLWISDLFINRFVYFGEWVFFYEGFLWTYGAFALMVMVGKYLMKKVNAVNFLVSSLLITLIHWIVTDFGVFVGSGMYPLTWAGWWSCLVAAIPFEQN
ncbi:MAG: DUF6580 family putative transport protein, partial [Bacteroidota bacterium]